MKPAPFLFRPFSLFITLALICLCITLSETLFSKPGTRLVFHLIPPQIVEKLELSKDQRNELQVLDSDVEIRLENLLTNKQLALYRQLRTVRRSYPETIVSQESRLLSDPDGTTEP